MHMISILAKRLQELRLKNNLSQLQMGQRTNLSPSVISSYETGARTPSLENLITIATTFRVSTDYLLGLEHSGCLDTDGLSEEEAEAVRTLLFALKKRTL